MKKRILIITLLIISSFIFMGSVNATVAVRCKYEMDFSKFNVPTNGHTMSFEITYDENGKAEISSFSNVNATELVGGKYIYTPYCKDHAEAYYKQNQSCPNVSFANSDTDNGFDMIVVSDSTIVPADAQAATFKKQEGGQQNKEEVVCSVNSKMRNESWDVKFTFYKVNGQNKWKASSSNGSGASENTSSGIVTVGNHGFTLDSSLANSIYSTGKCPTTYLRCNQGGVESITLTATKPDDVENCAQSVPELNEEKKNSGQSKNSNGNIRKTDDTVVGANFCSEEEAIKALKAVGYLLFIAKIMVPLIIIGLGTWDLVKAVQDPDKALQKQVKGLLIRVALGVIIFFIPRIVYVVLDSAEKFGVASSKSANCRKALLDPWNMGVDIGEIKNTD